MLPRIANLEADFVDALTNYVQHRSKQHGVMREVRGHVIHEGMTNTIQRSPTDSEKTNIIAAEAETTMLFDEIDSVDASYIIKKANEIAEQFGRQFSKTLFQTINETTTATGQCVDAGGKPLSNELIMDTLSKMAIDFEKSPHGDLIIVAAPTVAPKFKKLEEELTANPELHKKMKELMDRKRNEFREREINRNLVG